MSAVNLSTVYDDFIDDVVAKMTPAEILAFQLSEAEQDRLDDLLDRNNEGEVTAEETIELRQIVEFDRKMSLLKAKTAYDLSQK